MKKNVTLSDFANIPDVNAMIQSLKDLAMPENWSYSTATTRPHPILYNYLFHTFSRVYDEGKIMESGKHTVFNTGLVTPNQQEIFMLFNKSKTSGILFFDVFCTDSDPKLFKFHSLPERAVYFTDPTDLIYDLRNELRINITHIIDDPENFKRFPDEIKALDKHQLTNTFHGAIDHAKKRIRRNYLTAIPQFYRGEYCPDPNGQLQLLLPLCLMEARKADLALAVYKITNVVGGKNESFYSGRTCLTLDMAINNARLIAKPDDEWLRM